MKKFIAIAMVASALTLGGCADQLAKMQNAWTVLNQTTVPPSYALVTANAYDGLVAGATLYLKYCATNLSTPVCSADNRRAVIKNVRGGRVFRNQVEGYITTQTNVPTAIYNSLLDVVNLLNTTPAANFGTTK